MEIVSIVAGYFKENSNDDTKSQIGKKIIMTWKENTYLPYKKN